MSTKIIYKKLNGKAQIHACSIPYSSPTIMSPDSKDSMPTTGISKMYWSQLKNPTLIWPNAKLNVEKCRSQRSKVIGTLALDTELELSYSSFHLLTYSRKALAGFLLGGARTRVDLRTTDSSSIAIF